MTDEPARCRHCNEPLEIYPWGIAKFCGKCQKSQDARSVTRGNTRHSTKQFNPRSYFQGEPNNYMPVFGKDPNRQAPKRQRPK